MSDNAGIESLDDAEAKRIAAVRRFQADRGKFPGMMEAYQAEKLAELEADGFERPSDEQRAEAIQAAVAAARGSRRGRGRVGFYQDIAEHWIALEVAVALNAAVAALEAAGFCVKRPDHLRAAALEAARAHFWPHHVIIDSLDSDVHAAAIVGIEAALSDYRPITEAEYWEARDTAQSSA